MPGSDRRRWIQAAAITLGLLPLLGLCLQAASGGLGANPIEEITHETGKATLRLLLLTLAVTPLRRLSGLAWLAPLRRTLGLLAFFYATLHMLTYVVLDQFFDFRAMVEDVLERRYITAGMLAYLCILPLALTSTRTWMRRLGRRWQSLHRIVYVGAAAGVVHYLWLVKADLVPPLLYATVLSALLGYRWWHRSARGPHRVAGLARGR